MEELIKEYLKKLHDRTVRVKDKINNSFYKGIDPSEAGFFDVITIKDEGGREVKVLKGLLNVGLSNARKYQKEIIESARDGKDFGMEVVKSVNG